MNPFKALEQILNLLPENAEDILTKSYDLESKMSVLPNEADELAQKAETFLDDFLQELAQSIDVAAIEKVLAESTTYKKLKEQNISGLFTLPKGFDPEDYSQYGNLVSHILDKLQELLAPLDIANGTEIFSKIKQIITEILNIPENFDASDENMMAAYQQLKSDQLQDQIPELLNLMFGTHITPPSGDSLPQNDEALLNEIEKEFPKIEAQWKQLEGEQLDFVNVESAITNILPLVNNILAKMPDGSPSLNLSAMESFLQELQEQLKLLNTSETALKVETTLEILANLSAKYIPDTSSFNFITEFLQKAYHIVHFVVANRLLLPIKFHILSANESLPVNQGINPPPPATPQLKRASVSPASSAATEGTGVNANSNSGSSGDNTASGQTTHESNSDAANTITGSGSETGNKHFLSHLLAEGLAQLEAHEIQLAKDWISGEVFDPLAQAAENFAKQLISNFTNAVRIIWQDAQNASTTLQMLVEQIVNQVKAIISSIVNGAESLLKTLLNTITSSFKMVINWLLSIKIPATFLTQMAPSMSSMTQVSLLCLLIATPWDIIEKLKNIAVSDIENWAAG